MAGGTGNDSQILGVPFYGEPNSVCSYTYLVIGYDPQKHNLSKEEALNVLSYIQTRFFRFMVSIKKKTQNTTRELFQFAPVQDWSQVWTDAALYKKYSLSRSEIEYIESMIKPMGNDTLFEGEDLIDPNLGEFNLSECGVKIGDTIIYTPTGIEAVVAENNMVDVGGELYTLAQFTAKYMPRNKRSVSGVCQGPRYFSYNGVSLYKLRESFLGGNK